MPSEDSQQIFFMLRAGRIMEARHAAERMTRDQPDNAGGWSLLGSVLMRLGRPVMAAESLRKARVLDPGNREIAGSFYQALIQAGQRFESLSRFDGAESAYREAILLDPEAIPARLSLGRLLSAGGQYEEARSQLQAVLTRYPEQPDACAALALNYEYEGDYGKALDVLRTALQQSPVAPPIVLAYAVLARHFNEQSRAIALLEELLLNTAPESVQRDSHFALGKLFDATGDYERAFEHYRLGNRLLNYHYDPEQTRQTFCGITAAFSSSLHPRLPRSSNHSGLPVFIVGMPRSGTSLVEQILASHPDVYGAGERDDIARIVHTLGGPAPAVEAAGRLSVPVLDHAAQGYLDTLSRLAPAAARITDKMPHNFLALGYIDLLFPGCRIVHCVRDPRDTCLSIWFQQMTGNHPYTNDLDALADYYRQYRSLMEHWRRVIRVPVYEVRYEDLVGDIEQGARRLVEFCGLPWSDQCVRFHENTRVVSTPTYDDVRRPIHDRSAGRWRHYQRHLGALADLVGHSE
jgi:tetratricopeptide (TPR) repeat protein